jgi:hypothetical protein
VTGDSWDFLSSGQASSIVLPVATYCGGKLLSDNVNAFSSLNTPTTITFTRDFVVSDTILQGGTFSLSFRADDAAAFTLNGHDIGSCNPPGSNMGACQTCQQSVVSNAFLLGGGQTNHLQIVLTNLLSVDAGNGNTGWTSLAYSMCATQASSI